MMFFRDMFGLRPRIGDLAALLLKQAANNKGSVTWTYDPEENVLRSSGSAVINLVNMYREYANAPRSGRRALLEKYSSMLSASERETPKLWSLAAKGIILAVRSKHDYMVLSIAGRTDPKSVNEGIAWPFVGDLCIRLLYDFGPNMSHVSKELVATWGQTEEVVRQQALNNLKSLQRPMWSSLEGGVYKLLSEVAYEETWLLVDGVVDQLPFAQTAVLMSVNRGILLAADAQDEHALSAMLQMALTSLQNNPWPMSGLMLARDNGHWREFNAESIVAKRAKAVEALSLATTYSDQKTALEEHFEKTGEDIFVATFDLRQRGDDIAGIYSWCVWTEGVLTLLPKTDVVIFGKGEEERRESLIVQWEHVMQVCERYLQPTIEDPPRFLIADFPTTEEWEQLKNVGEVL
jgi:hypothetical protein